MGIEQQLAELNKNIVLLNENVALLHKIQGGETATDKPPAKKTKQTKKAPAATQKPKADDVAVEEASDETSYDDVKQAILKISKEKGRSTAVAVLQRHGVNKVPELNESQYTSVVDMVTKTIDGEFDPEGSNQ